MMEYIDDIEIDHDYLMEKIKKEDNDDDEPVMVDWMANLPVISMLLLDFGTFLFNYFHLL
jgi:hypothetical protein